MQLVHNIVIPVVIVIVVVTVEPIRLLATVCSLVTGCQWATAITIRVSVIGRGRVTRGIGRCATAAICTATAAVVTTAAAAVAVTNVRTIVAYLPQTDLRLDNRR